MFNALMSKCLKQWSGHVYKSGCICMCERHKISFMWYWIIFGTLRFQMGPNNQTITQHRDAVLSIECFAFAINGRKKKSNHTTEYNLWKRSKLNRLAFYQLKIVSELVFGDKKMYTVNRMRHLSQRAQAQDKSTIRQLLFVQMIRCICYSHNELSK